MAILESLACGVPVICSDHFGNKEIIEDGVNGYVFKDKNHAQKILTRLINRPKELAKLKETTKRHFVEKLDSRHMAYQYIKLMEEIMGNKSDDIKKPDQNLEIIEQFKQEVKLKEEVEAKKNLEKFTIITSGYNKGKYLNEWADSIIKQNYRPLEVIFANDKSTDNTMKVINDIKIRFENNGIEFELVDNPKQLYCGGSYYNLTNYINGAYVGVLDADDMLADGAVDYIVDLYKKNPDVYWIYTQFLWCNEQMVKGRMGLNSPPPKGQSLLDLGDRGVHGIGSGWRTFSNKIKRPDKLFGRHLHCAVDKNMGYRLEEAGPGLFTNKKCYIHRGHPIGSKDSVSSTKNAMNMWKQVIKEAHSRRKKYNKKVYPITR
jgi:glycosyltransferase involved in cell wall biosynthesis